jgi:hypothetical protein
MEYKSVPRKFEVDFAPAFLRRIDLADFDSEPRGVQDLFWTVVSSTDDAPETTLSISFELSPALTLPRFQARPPKNDPRKMRARELWSLVYMPDDDTVL